MSNGERKEFQEKVKLFIKLLFSPKLLQEVAHDMQLEYDESRRHAANQKKIHGQTKQNDLNHCES